MQQQCQNLYYAQYFSVCCVVGYNTAETIQGNQGTGVCFVPVSKEGKMLDLKITGYNGEYSENGISCCKLDIFGRSGDPMFWLDLAEFDDGETIWPAQYGWWSADGVTEYNNVTLEPGEGIWLNIPDTAFRVQSAGQVNSDSIPVDLVVGNQLCPNPTPVTLKMGEAWMDGYDGEYAENGISCCKLDIYGRSGDPMFWLDLDEFDDGETVWPAQYGWWSADGTIDYSESVMLAPGEAIWLNSPSVEFTLNWPSPLKK